MAQVKVQVDGQQKYSEARSDFAAMGESVENDAHVTSKSQESRSQSSVELKRSRTLVYSQQCSEEKRPQQKGTFSKIFKWFRRRGKSTDSISVVGSDDVACSEPFYINSPGNKGFSPLSRSRSEDNHGLEDAIGFPKNFNPFPGTATKSSSIIETHTYSNTITNRIEIASSESVSVGVDERKRKLAPQPPKSTKTSQGDTLSTSESYDESKNPFYQLTDYSSDSCRSANKRYSRADSDISVTSKTKRKAPDPPGMEKNKKTLDSSSSPGAAGTSKSPTNGNEKTAITEHSNDSTLRSVSNCSDKTARNSISSNTSTQSLRLHRSGSIGQVSEVMSPLDYTPGADKPWFRRKGKVKQEKPIRNEDIMDQAYEFWRPELQFREEKDENIQVNQVSLPSDEKDKSVLSRVMSSYKNKRKSQISPSPTGSQLDLKTQVQLKKDGTVKMVDMKKDHDKMNLPKTMMLTQKDVSGGTTENCGEDNSTLNKSECHGIYDNHTIDSYSSQDTLRIGDRSSESAQPRKINSDEAMKESNAKSSKAEETPKMQERTDINSATQPNPTQASPGVGLMQMANLDAEQFYKLAKDIKSPLVKVALARSREKSGLPPQISQPTQSSPVPSPKSKNFGIRMNNFFSPDVSVILEASESVTSSATTPAEDGFSDLLSVITQNNDDVYQEFNFQNETLAINREASENAKKLWDELCDVRQEIARINDEENEAKLERERTLSRNNSIKFGQQSGTEGSRPPSAENRRPFPPLDINAKPESTLKWECGVCTLINLPWKITCEACATRRPTNPTRIKEDGTRISRSNDLPSPVLPVTSENKQPEPNLNTANKEVKKEIRQTRWELELKKYFGGKESNVTATDFSAANFPNAIVLSNQVSRDVAQFPEGVKGNGSENLDLRTATPNRLDTLISEFDDKEKSFYPKEARKKSAVTSFGAVKNTISIFDQKITAEPPENEKKPLNRQERRRSIGAVKNQANIFERCETENQIEKNKGKNTSKVFSQVKTPHLKNTEVDISSAISKFDGMAAIAEVERLNPRIPRTGIAKKPRKFLIQTECDFTKARSHSPRKISSPTWVPHKLVATKRMDNLIGTNQENRSETWHDNIDSTAKMETQNSEVSYELSIGTNSFDLMQATEFKEIEAIHSRRGSPIVSIYEDARLGDGDSDSEEFYEDAPMSSSDIEAVVMKSFQNHEMQQEFNTNQQDITQFTDISNRAIDPLTRATDLTNQVSILPGTEDRLGSHHLEASREVAELSEQLTLPKGISKFKGKNRAYF